MDWWFDLFGGYAVQAFFYITCLLMSAGFLIWLHTPWGKKWLSWDGSLPYDEEPATIKDENRSPAGLLHDGHARWHWHTDTAAHASGMAWWGWDGSLDND